MEVPRARSFGTQGRRKPTHDFLSLYSHSSVQQDPPRPPSQGSYLKTHDFLQPLERKGRKASSAKEDAAAEEISSKVDKPQPLVEHHLPGGIGTYSISHISYFNNQRHQKPEASVFTVAQESSTDRNNENSNCSSYSGNGFTLWEESAVNKGKTGKENNAVDKPISGDSAAKLGQWALPERTSQSYSITHHNSFNSLPSSQTTAQKSQSFIEMIKSAKGDCAQDEEFGSEAFILKKECSNTEIGELRVKVDGKSTDQKPNTPRSKHSATEQRRRSKINDRFQMLRELIPQSDQKRDKASFLLEVIEYIHFLQEKVHKYEGSYQGWSHEAEKLMPWRNNHRPAESYVDQCRGTNGGSGLSPRLMFASKFDEENITISPSFPGRTQNVESGMCPATTVRAIDQHRGMINKAMKIPVSSELNSITSAPSGSPDIWSQLAHRLASDAENNICQPSVQCQTYSSATEVTVANDKVKEKGLTIEGGTISMSSVYSRGLLNKLTQALQSSGVDLSRASVSVQIELGKQANIGQSVPTSGAKDDELVSRNQEMARFRVVSTEDSDKPVKKLKARRN